jgi:FMN reductase [NAD(P)H]
MNETLTTMMSHRSVRSYTDQAVDEETLSAIIRAVQQSPSSINGQQISLVVTRDPARRKRISEIANGQPWIAQAPVFITVVIDFHKTAVGVEMAGKKQVIHESVEGSLAGAVDAGIVLGNLMTAAESLGLGIVPIGGIRANPAAMIELLELPPMTFPVVGMCLGHVADGGAVKPRLPMGTFLHDETYRTNGLEGAIEQYDRTLEEHWKKVSRGGGASWSRSIASSYCEVYFPDVHPVMRSQGFLNDK